MTLKNTLIGAMMLVTLGGIAGYQIGSWSGKKAREEIARLKNQGLEAEQLHDTAVKKLRAELAGNEKEYQRSRKELEEKFSKQKGELDTLISSQSSKIAELERSANKLKDDRDGLQAQLSKSASPDQKKKLLAEIAVLNAKIAQMENEQAARICSSLAVPEDLLRKLKESK
jgi:gas vesicle protein